MDLGTQYFNILANREVLLGMFRLLAIKWSFDYKCMTELAKGQSGSSDLRSSMLRSCNTCLQEKTWLQYVQHNHMSCIEQNGLYNRTEYEILPILKRTFFYS